MKRYFPILIVFLLISCSLRKPAEKYPDKLIIGFPVGSSGGAFKKWYGPVADYLKRTLNLKSVEFFTSSDYAPVIEAMKAKKVDIAYFGELSYIIAHEKAGAEALVMHVTSDGTPLPTQSCMITWPGSGLYTMEDIRKRSHELTLAFADPASTSGHLYPRDYLNSIGLEPEKSFKQVVFADGHLAAILSIKSHKVDIACTGLNYPNYLVKNGRLSKDDYLVIWISVPYPAAPVSIRGDLPEGFKIRVRQAFIDLPKKDTAVWNHYIHLITMFYPQSILKKIIYVPAVDSVYNPIRRIAKKIPYMSFTK